MILEPEKISLIQGPTPLHRLNFLSDYLGIDLWIKRDDLTGFAGGGNKGRKLEYLMPEIIAGGAQAVVACGALQSNFIRQLGAACSMHSIPCHAAVMDLPYSQSAGPPSEAGLKDQGGNVLLDELFGVKLHEYPNGEWEELYDRAEQLALKREHEEFRVYRMPIGGSSGLGAYAFHKACEEVGSGFDYVLTASSSGSTQTGLTAGFLDKGTQVIGICADPEPEVMEDLTRVADELHALFPNLPHLQEGDFDLRLDYAGEAYGVPSQAGLEAAKLAAQSEGIVLDPIYSAKAFAGLLDLADKKEIGGRVLFWHTGGFPAVFALP